MAKGQSDAAAALGMTRALALRRIILPQAIRTVIPSLGNYLISLFKDTALCSVVSVQEVLFTAQIMAARNYQYFTLYTVVGTSISRWASRRPGWSTGWSGARARATGGSTAHDRAPMVEARASTSPSGRSR